MAIDLLAVPEENRNQASETDWKEIVAWVGDLPPLPHVAAQALNLIEDPDATAGKLTELLGGDTALAARVLKIANSAMFSRQRAITTINQAIMTIGFKTLKGIIVAATLRQLNRKYGQIEKMIWENSLCTAIACRQIAYKMRKNYVEELFLLGLLHDLGKLVLMRQVPQDYKKVIESSRDGKTYIEAELRHFNFGHPLIGALVAKKWNFPMETCQVILHHHDPSLDELEPTLKEKTFLVCFGDLVAHSLGYGHGEGYPDMSEALIKTAAALQFDEEMLTQLKEDVAKVLEDTSSIFG